MSPFPYSTAPNLLSPPVISLIVSNASWSPWTNVTPVFDTGHPPLNLSLVFSTTELALWNKYHSESFLSASGTPTPTLTVVLPEKACLALPHPFACHTINPTTSTISGSTLAKVQISPSSSVSSAVSPASISVSMPSNPATAASVHSTSSPTSNNTPALTVTSAIIGQPISQSVEQGSVSSPAEAPQTAASTPWLIATSTSTTTVLPSLQGTCYCRTVSPSNAVGVMSCALCASNPAAASALGSSSPADTSSPPSSPSASASAVVPTTLLSSTPITSTSTSTTILTGSPAQSNSDTDTTLTIPAKTYPGTSFTTVINGLGPIVTVHESPTTVPARTIVVCGSDGRSGISSCANSGFVTSTTKTTTGTAGGGVTVGGSTSTSTSAAAQLSRNSRKLGVLLPAILIPVVIALVLLSTCAACLFIRSRRHRRSSSTSYFRQIFTCARARYEKYCIPTLDVLTRGHWTKWATTRAKNREIKRQKREAEMAEDVQRVREVLLRRASRGRSRRGTEGTRNGGSEMSDMGRGSGDGYVRGSGSGSGAVPGPRNENAGGAGPGSSYWYTNDDYRARMSDEATTMIGSGRSMTSCNVAGSWPPPPPSPQMTGLARSDRDDTERPLMTAGQTIGFNNFVAAYVADRTGKRERGRQRG